MCSLIVNCSGLRDVMVDELPPYWQAIKGPHLPVVDAPRGCYVLYVNWDITQEIWEQIISLTYYGDLGYMSSKSPNSVTRGRFAGCFAICVHLSDAFDERNVIRDNLTYSCLSQYIHRYQVNYDMFGNVIGDLDFVY